MFSASEHKRPPAGMIERRSKLGQHGQVNQIMVLVIILVVALVAAFLVVNVGLKPMASKGGQQTQAPAKQAKKEAPRAESKKSGGHGAEGEGTAVAEGEPSNFFKIEGIIVNPAATGGSRFLSATIGFECDSEESCGAFKSMEIKIRDALIAILSSKTVSELADYQSREALRRQILKAANQICQPARAEAIYFVDFVLQ